MLGTSVCIMLGTSVCTMLGMPHRCTMLGMPHRCTMRGIQPGYPGGYTAWVYSPGILVGILASRT